MSKFAFTTSKNFLIFIFSRFVPPQTSSGNRFLAQQNSPVPSPYAPQSPAGYMPYSHPPTYTPHPQLQQGKYVMFVIFYIMSVLPSCASFMAFYLCEGAICLIQIFALIEVCCGFVCLFFNLALLTLLCGVS